MNPAAPASVSLESRSARTRNGDTTSSGWVVSGYAMLAVRFVQGFIYWGGGSRRFIYAPQKLDPHAANWMANKLQSAMPGAILGTGHIVDFLLRHFSLLYASVIFFSAVELIFGLFLMLGLFTRLSALVTIALSFVLMLLFGWQGATCIDEWTMAACNFAMGMSLLAAGSSAWSLDALISRRLPAVASHAWFPWVASGSLPLERFRPTSLLLTVITIAFVTLTYNYYRGAILTPYHSGPTSPSLHHLSISEARKTAQGGVSFNVYLDGGTADVPAHVVGIFGLDADGRTVAEWTAKQLAALPPSAIINDYHYNRFTVGVLGLAAGMGARAHIVLPPPALGDESQATQIELQTIDNKMFAAPLVSMP